ncbi:MAG: hypothetical protein JW745_03375 [Sedimentisphaerales bacterium]|nr:hypothetical protein [Sedimentisphaerales bacterium]MBN2844294.1 hypothetical protein [Sedimentisphaerales bacterium]
MIFNGLQFEYAIAALLAVIAVLVVTHLLTIKHTRLVVPSVLFWGDLADKSHTVRWKGRFGFWATLVFLVFIASVFIIALMEPSLNRTGKNTVYIIDNSRVMSEPATNDGNIPLEFAKEYCLSRIKRAADSDKITVIAVADLPLVLANSADDRLTAINAVAGLSGSQAQAPYGMVQAVFMADNIARGNSDCLVQVISAIDVLPFIASLPTARQFCQFNPVSDFSLFSPKDKVKTKVYLSENIPAPLELLLRVASGAELVADKAQADMLITADVGDMSLGKPAIIVVSSSQTAPAQGEITFSPFFTRHLVSTGKNDLAIDLFAPMGAISPELAGPDAEVLLADSQSGAWAYLYSDRTIILAESLFLQRSNFWKQPQFLPIMSGLFELVGKSDVFIDRAVNYTPAEAGGILVGPDEANWFGIVSLLIFTALVLLLLELYLYCRGKII